MGLGSVLVVEQLGEPDVVIGDTAGFVACQPNLDRPETDNEFGVMELLVGDLGEVACERNAGEIIVELAGAGDHDALAVPVVGELCVDLVVSKGHTRVSTPGSITVGTDSGIGSPQSSDSRSSTWG